VVGAYTDAAGVFHGYQLSHDTFTTDDYPRAPSSPLMEAITPRTIKPKRMHRKTYERLQEQHFSLLKMAWCA
jgi:hypothetical protein